MIYKVELRSQAMHDYLISRPAVWRVEAAFSGTFECFKHVTYRPEATFFIDVPDGEKRKYSASVSKQSEGMQMARSLSLEFELPPIRFPEVHRPTGLDFTVTVTPVSESFARQVSERRTVVSSQSME